MSDPLRIVLVSPRNPLNIGAAARAMSNFGFSMLRLVNPYEVAFKEARSAVRSAYILEQAEVFATVGEAVADCKLVIGTSAAERRDLHVPLWTLQNAAIKLREQTPAALMFGSEKFGLSNEDISHCHALLRIPTRIEHGSMNLGQAVAICLYEMRRGNSEAAAEDISAANPATAEQYERTTALLMEALEISGYIRERNAESSALKLRRFLLRQSLTAGDADTWQGMLRQILWKLKQNEPR